MRMTQHEAVVKARIYEGDRLVGSVPSPQAEPHISKAEPGCPLALVSPL